MKQWKLLMLGLVVALAAACSGPTAPYPEPDDPDKPDGPDDPNTGMVIEPTWFG